PSSTARQSKEVSSPGALVMRPLARLRILMAAAAVSCCALSAQAADVNFITDFGFNGRHAYYYVALEKGYYKAEGLNVNILRGQGSIDAVKKVASGAADIGFADAGALVLARGNDAIPVKLLAIIYASPPHAIFTTADRGIKVPKDLEGKTLADSAFSAIPVIFKAYAQAANVDASKVTWISAESAALPCLPLAASTRSDNSRSANRCWRTPSSPKRSCGSPTRMRASTTMATGSWPPRPRSRTTQTW